MSLLLSSDLLWIVSENDRSVLTCEDTRQARGGACAMETRLNLRLHGYT